MLPLNGKVPRVKHGLKDASTDADVIRQWLSRWPDSNIGITTGADAGVWVLDLDLHDPRRSGILSIQAAEAEHGRLPETLTVRTGTGGLHLYWMMPQDGNMVRNRTEVLPGVDVRGHGGYVVVPPSIHPDSGQPYVVPEDGRRPIADAPDWLVDLVRPQKRVARPPSAAPRAKLRPGEYEREAWRRIRSDPGVRRRAAEAIGATIGGEGGNEAARHVRCPQCGRPSVWWAIVPEASSGSVRCSHVNSCGWWGSLVDVVPGLLQALGG